MAARENQGLLIGVIILVLLTLVLALAAFLGLSKAGENATNLKAAEKKLLLAEKLGDAHRIESDILMAYAGDFGPSVAEVQTQIDSLNRLATTRDLESGGQSQIKAVVERVEALKQAYEKDMLGSVATEGGQPAQEPTWRDTIKNLTKLVADKNKQLNIQLNQSRQSEAEAKGEINNLQKEVEANKAALAESQNELQQEKKRSLEKENELKSKLDQAVAKNRTVNEELQNFRQRTTKEIRGLQNDIAGYQSQNEILKTRINRYEREVFDRPDGQVIKVASGLGSVFIDLGSEDGLTNNRTFAIYDQRVTNFEEDKHKAMIEVTRVHPYRAEARITEENPVDPILTGDFVLTATWDPGFAVPIALAGVFDLDGDIYDDRDKLIQMIERNGGKVVASHDDDGNIIGKIDGTVRYLVKGDPPSLAEDASAQLTRNSTAIIAAMQEMEQQAEKNTIQVIGLQKLLSRMGVRAKPKTLQIEKRSGPFPKRAPSDVVNGY